MTKTFLLDQNQLLKVQFFKLRNYKKNLADIFQINSEILQTFFTTHQWIFLLCIYIFLITFLLMLFFVHKQNLFCWIATRTNLIQKQQQRKIFISAWVYLWKIDTFNLGKSTQQVKWQKGVCNWVMSQNICVEIFLEFWGQLADKVISILLACLFLFRLFQRWGSKTFSRHLSIKKMQFFLLIAWQVGFCDNDFILC